MTRASTLILLCKAVKRSCWPIGRALLLAAACISLLPANGQSVTAPHGSVELLADAASVQAGKPFRAGLHFQLEKGWHVYWINPGDSGEPPKVRWTLPAGFRAGALEWPTPQRIEDHSLIDYGYEDEVLLPVEIHPPAALPQGREVQLAATAMWLVCRETCIPAHAALNLNLSAGARPETAKWGTLFAKTEARLPKPVPSGWRLTASVVGHQFVVDADTGRRESQALFFPVEPNLIENAAPQAVSSYARGIRLRLVKSDQLLKLPARLVGVLVLGPGKAYDVSIPVAGP
jgi:thiol:disulfide interchange protein DsbD